MTDEKPKTRSLPVPLTADEIDIKKGELVSAEGDLHEAEVAESSAAAAWATRKKALAEETQKARTHLSGIATVIRERREFRNVEVVEDPDYKSKVVNIVRTDTGEIIESRVMSSEEVQKSFFALRAVPISDDEPVAASKGKKK